METKSVYVVAYVSDGNTYIESVFNNEEAARQFVEKQNRWELSEQGNGDFWYYAESLLVNE